MNATPDQAEAEPTGSAPVHVKGSGFEAATGRRPMLSAGLPRARAPLLILASLVVIIAGLRAAGSMVNIFLMAAFFAAICTVPLTWMQRRAVPSKLAVGLTAGGILAFGSLLVVLVALSANSFLADLPKNQERLSALTGSAMAFLQAHGIPLSGDGLLRNFDLGMVMGFAGAMVAKLTGVIASGFLVIITVVFILLEVSGFPHKLRVALVNPDQSLAGLQEFGDAARRYLIIKTLLGAAVGLSIGAWLWLLGVNYAFLLGFVAFLLNFVPYVGCYIAAVPALLLALVERGSGSALLALSGYLVVNVVFGFFLEPRLMGAQLGLSALVALSSLLIWGWVLGPVGMILSVPLTVLLRIALEANKDTRWIAVLLGPEPARAKTRDTDAIRSRPRSITPAQVGAPDRRS